MIKIYICPWIEQEGNDKQFHEYHVYESVELAELKSKQAIKIGKDDYGYLGPILPFRLYEFDWDELNEEEQEIIEEDGYFVTNNFNRFPHLKERIQL